MSIYYEIQNKTKHNPKKIAIVQGDKKISYLELNNEINEWKGYIKTTSENPVERIGILLSNAIDYAIVSIAVLSEGYILVPLNNTLNLEDTIAAAKTAGITQIICDSSELEEKIKKHGFKTISIESKNKFMSNGRCHDNQQYADKENSGRIYLLTSGSTGHPKVVVVEEKTMIERIVAGINEFSLNDKDCILISTPLYHSLGIRTILMGLYGFMTTVVMKGFSANSWMENVYNNKVTFTNIAPVQISQILTYFRNDYGHVKEHMASIKTILSTTSYLSDDLRKEFSCVVSGAFYNYIASSETEYIAIRDCKNERLETNSLGLPFSNVDVRVLYEDRFAHAYEVGEIVCKSNQLLDGYFDDESDLMERSFYKGYFRTGDLGYFDKHHYLHYEGRKKNIIVCSGVNIVPEDIEEKLKSCQDIVDCKAFAIPDKHYGEIVGLLVATKNLTEKDIKLYCLRLLSKQQQPRRIFMVDKIERDNMGKFNFKQIEVLLKR